MTYITLPELKSAPGITDPNDDDVLSLALGAAVEAVDGHCRRHFREVDVTDTDAKTVRVYTTDSLPTLFIDDAARIDGVEERSHRAADYQQVDASEWVGLPDNAEADGWPYERIRRVFGSWPRGVQAVRVTGWFGWPATPKSVKQATLLQAMRWAKRSKDAPFGVALIPTFDGQSGMRLLAKLDADVEVMLNRFVHPRGLIGG